MDYDMFFEHLKVHNKLMYEIIIDMNLFLSFAKYKLELTIIENLKMAKMCSIIYDAFQNVPPSKLSSLKLLGSFNF
jgi:hypothetical protein